MNHWLALIPLAPLAGALLIALFGRKLSGNSCAWLATGCLFISALVVLALWFSSGTTPYFSVTLFKWMAIDDWAPTIGLKVDQVSLIMITVASCVGFLIHLFSVRFMGKEEGVRRYFFYLNLFVAGMLLFVMADNLILLYLGWEVMGLCSYALIAFYYQKQHNAYCGRKAFVVTRIGDTALVLMIILTFAHFGTLDINGIIQSMAAAASNTWLVTTLALLLLVAAMAKSAQFPLHIWLPDAMTGPSPVSALIHAATMVTAGVYLIARFHLLFDLVPMVRFLVALVGCFTAVYAASVALSQTGLKRILAYSTISQVGYMFAGLGVGAYSLALFHLMVHACFKALLFMGAGVIAEAYQGNGDIRKMGGLAKRQPLFSACYLIACLTLAALPLVTASFYSKDAIITAGYTAPHHMLIVGLGLLGSIMTGLYSMRLYLLVFHGSPRAPIEALRIPVTMMLPLVVLAFFSITLGFIQMPSDWPFGLHLLLPWLNSVLGLPSEPSASIQKWLELAGSLTALVGIALAFVAARRELNGNGLSQQRFLYQAWYIDQGLGGLFKNGYRGLAQACQGVEQKLLNQAVVGSVVSTLRGSNRALSDAQAGELGRYLCLMVLGAVLILGFVIGII